MNFTLPFLTAFLTCAILTPVAVTFAKKFGLVDDPRRLNPGAIHKRIVPRAGGLPIYVAVLLASLIFIGVSKKILGVFAGGMVLVIVGLIDDKINLKSYQKLFAQILAAVLVVASGIGIAFITNPLFVIGNFGGL